MSDTSGTLYPLTEVRPQSDTPPFRLYTWHWRAALAEDRSDELVLVRISLGKPRWISPQIAAAIPYVSDLAPYGIFTKDRDVPLDEFERLYRIRLNSKGVDVIEQQFRHLREANGDLPLALLCYEATPDQCHRGMFATWWLEQTGEVIPEYRPESPASDDPEPSQTSLL
jgi:hypothetical protein